MSNIFQNAGMLQALLARMQDGLSVLDAEGKHIFVNDALCRMTGFTREELLASQRPFPYWPTEALDAIEQAFAQTLAGDAGTYELLFKRKDGTRFWVIVSPSEMKDENGAIVAYFATVKDISERKRLEVALQESEQRWRSIAENPFDFVVVIDRDFRYVYVNHTAPGITEESLIGKATPFDFTDSKFHPAMREAYAATFATGQATSYDVYVPQVDAWYASIVGPIRTHGEVSSISILTREITQQKRAEEALRQSEHQLRESHKLQSIGTLAGGIAHDLNNILTPILSYAELAQRSVHAATQARSYVDGIQSAALRARDLVQRILLFGRRREPRKAVLELGERIRDGMRLVTATTPSNIRVKLTLPAEPIYVLADSSQLDQVLTNLATNAVQAMGDVGGSLELSLSTLAAKEDGAPSHAQLTVKDTGPGMDQETLRRAFEPFFTTKAVGAGTGLGLSIVHGIVLEHGGDVTAESSLGGGTSFTVRLPCVTHNESPPHSAPSIVPTPQTHSLRVLCVDDEPALLDVVCKTLQRYGHTVTALPRAADAIALFQRDPSAFDVLLTDQTMPDMLGTALVSELKGLRPSLPCVLMTGLGDHTMQAEAKALGVRETLAKPFLLAELQSAVERAGSR